MLLWEHPTQSGWRHRLRAPEQRKEVFRLLLLPAVMREAGSGDKRGE